MKRWVAVPLWAGVSLPLPANDGLREAKYSQSASVGSSFEAMRLATTPSSCEKGYS